MKLDRVTITGADDSVRPEDLLALSTDFPYVEWGILVSKTSMGFRRFPSESWLLDFRSFARRHPRLQASMHICGRWLRSMLLGETPQELWTIFDCFQRAQLNFHAEGIEWKIDRFRNVLTAFSDQGQKEFIFQIDGNRGEQLLRETVSAKDFEVSCVPLFDLSHGAGVLPEGWPKPIAESYHGYAGGLGPDNLQEQIPLIAKAAGECRFWIDMESRVRSDEDSQFDLAKVRRCLEITQPFIVKDI